MFTSAGIVHSPLREDIKIPEVTFFNLIASFCGERLAANPDKDIYVDCMTGQKRKAGEIFPLINKICCGFTKKGFRKGDVLAIVSENHVDYSLALLASMKLGCSLICGIPGASKAEMANFISNSGAKFIICDPGSSRKIRQVTFESREKIAEIFVFGSIPYEEFTPFDSILSDDGQFELPSLDIDLKQDVIYMVMSSGTTGTPKIVQHTNYSLVASWVQIPFSGIAAATNNLSSLVLSRMYHTSGLSYLINVLLTCSPLYFFSSPHYNDVDILKVIHNYKPTFISFYPVDTLQLCKSANKSNYDLTSVQCLVSSASKLEVEVQKQLKEVFPGIKCIFDMYGTTEGILFISTAPKFFMKPNSIGVLVKFAEAKVVDTTSGKILGPHQAGELRFRTPTMMIGYKDNPEASKNVYDAEGFYCSGDVGYYDEDGYFYLVDRMKNLIKSVEVISGSELEEILLSHPDVASVAVIGVPDEKWGEVPRAYIVKHGESTMREEDFVSFLNDKVSEYKRLRGGVVFLDSLPIGFTGKILKNKLQGKAVLPVMED